MPIRFSTEAANEDILGEDPAPAAAPEGTTPGREESTAGRNDRSAEAKPGKDIKAARFARDKDSSKP